MSDAHAELDAALEQLVSAARDHLAAVKAAEGRIDDDEVWQRYVELNNAAVNYDRLLLDNTGDVTPWDLDPIDPEDADEQYGVGLGGVDGGEVPDEQPVTVSVRQRRDYHVPKIAALLRVAEAARRELPPGIEPSEPEPPRDPAGAVAELLEAGDGSLASLDIPELEPLAGVTVICEVAQPVNVDALVAGTEDDLPATFAVNGSDTAVRLIVERPYDPDADEDEETQ
ncbi:MAG: hypothetical protein ACRDUA_08970 [Micromonosporaceae bacterium]